jgi:hypothetical protein
MNEDAYPGFAIFAGWPSFYDSSFFSLSEEIREGIEEHKEEIHSKEDMDRLIHELKMKK